MALRTAVLLGSVVGLVMPWAIPAAADSPRLEWEEHVPAELRGLVTQTEFESMSDRLVELRRGGLELLTDERMVAIASSPCGDSIYRLLEDFQDDPRVSPALDKVAAGMVDLPEEHGRVNPWQVADGQALVTRMVETFADWCLFEPQIVGTSDDGLKYIMDFAWFYYHNPAGQDFVQGRNPLDPGEPLATGLVFTNDFSNQRGAFMNSAASRKYIAQWVDDPRIEIQDYQRQTADEYESWNAFFAREITIDEETRTVPSRPVTLPDRDYVVSAPTDCIMNPLVQVLADERGTEKRAYIESPLRNDTVLDVKGIPIALNHLLGSADQSLKDKFVGGTGLSCVLMPNTYHHFHAPVSGTIVHAEVVSKGEGDLPRGTYGYPDFPNWAPSTGNVGQPGTDFSQFERFERGVIVIEVAYANLEGGTNRGWVASIPVGLDTIGSVSLDESTVPGTEVKRGYTRLGNFYYGGSLDILLFSKGLASGAIQTRMGNQITLLEVGSLNE